MVIMTKVILGQGVAKQAEVGICPTGIWPNGQIEVMRKCRWCCVLNGRRAGLRLKNVSFESFKK